MDKKWLPLTVVLGAAGAAVVTASVWPEAEKPPPPQILCHGALTRQTAELIDDGEGGEAGAEEWESKGQSSDYAVFKACSVWRVGPDDGSTRGMFGLIIQDERHDSGSRKNSVPLGAGFKGWVRPDEAEATLPPGCAARMGSTAPYVTVTLTRSWNKAEKEAMNPAERDTARRDNATVVREAATRLAERYGCAG
ncbi:hypothetical protein HHL19_10055 [Streptomyces sp. R302]|uniref:hypothetical protein n=1 Tax=unclassified Streptomyces TaxID=2593676 RepID=UPI00145E321D|nr:MULTISPECIES: hypothetical protein [unclassified Streptomyces]NML50011.1 hypothetical protein [Streptomyces sp. R301]NML79002.1 hypothetical protein [Streptomyces sp. R302]